MSPNPPDSQRDTKKMVTVSGASFSGAVIEWYDFFLYGTASALVFNELFFPEFDATTGTIASVATFGAGYVARPIGGLVFGHFGDRIGRKTLLIVTMLMMGISTVLIGLLPTYETIGLAAPILLVALRLMQGFALGGEYAGAALLTIEHAPKEHRAFWASIPQAASPSGILIGTGVFALVSLLPESEFMSWGWRIPFLLSAVMLAIGLFVRLRVDESPAFIAVQNAGKVQRMPLLDLFRTYPRNIVLTFGARLAETVSYGVFNVFAIAYLENTLEMPTGQVLTGVLLASGIAVVVAPITGAVADRVGTRIIYLFGAGVVIVFAFPFFLLLNSENLALVWTGLIVGYVLGGTVMFAVQAAFFAELFGTNVRYSGLSVAFQASAIVGGFTPLIATSLAAVGSNTPWLVAGFLTLVGTISFVCTLVAKRTDSDEAPEPPISQSTTAS